MTRKESADHLASVETDDRIDSFFIGIALREGHGGFTGHCEFMLHAGDVDIMSVVGMSGCKMPGKSDDLETGIELGFDHFGIHNHTSRPDIKCLSL